MKKTLLMLLTFAMAAEYKFGDTTIHENMFFEQKDAVDHVNFKSLHILPKGKLIFSNSNSIANATTIVSVKNDAIIQGNIIAKDDVSLVLIAQSDHFIESKSLLPEHVDLQVNTSKAITSHKLREKLIQGLDNLKKDFIAISGGLGHSTQNASDEMSFNADFIKLKKLYENYIDKYYAVYGEGYRLAPDYNESLAVLFAESVIFGANEVFSAAAQDEAAYDIASDIYNTSKEAFFAMTAVYREVNYIINVESGFECAKALQKLAQRVTTAKLNTMSLEEYSDLIVSKEAKRERQLSHLNSLVTLANADKEAFIKKIALKKNTSFESVNRYFELVNELKQIDIKVPSRASNFQEVYSKYADLNENESLRLEYAAIDFATVDDKIQGVAKASRSANFYQREVVKPISMPSLFLEKDYTAGLAMEDISACAAFRDVISTHSSELYKEKFTQAFYKEDEEVEEVEEDAEGASLELTDISASYFDYMPFDSMLFNAAANKNL